MTSSARLKTLSPENRFAFTCPVFGADVEIRTCLHLQEMQYRGKAPEVRKGCQACITASKCPIIHIVKDLNEHNDPYYSAEPKVGRLSNKVLNAIAPIMVPDFVLRQDRYADIPEKQKQMIRDCNGLSGAKQLKGIDLETLAAPAPTPSSKAHKPRGVAPTTESYLDTAAATGDLAAAINIAVTEGASN